jgi:hypothetical protein
MPSLFVDLKMRVEESETILECVPIICNVCIATVILLELLVGIGIFLIKFSCRNSLSHTTSGLRKIRFSRDI